MKKYSVLLVAGTLFCQLFDQRNPIGENFVTRISGANVMTLQQTAYDIFAENNGDERLALHAGSFTKTLEHDLTTGLLTISGNQNYRKLIRALQTGTQADFNAIQRAPGATIKLVNPQAAFAQSMIGVPCTNIKMPKAPRLSSLEAAADIIEVYLQVIARDVAFEDYGTGIDTDIDLINGGSITNNAAAILTTFGDAYKGPRENGIVTAQVLFRGIANGDLAGPYISQFLLLPTHPFFQSIEQPQYIPIAQAREFSVAWDDFVAIQNGTIPKTYDSTDFSGTRHIFTGRDVGTVVHNDAPGEFFNNAVNILLTSGASLSADLPYQNNTMPNEAPFITMAITDINRLVYDASQEALKHAWAHKWLANRRLRPEAMGGLIHQVQITGQNPYNLNAAIFTIHAGIDVMTWVNERNKLQATIPDNPLSPAQADTYLLAQLYPEGSPAHPAYPAGHATIAGACATIVKAFFNDDDLLITYVQPVKPNPADPTMLVSLTPAEGSQLLTIGGELNKLASNIALARDFAGVHYRSDGDLGIQLGEAIALKFLEDYARTYHEQRFNGFTLRKMNGQRIRISQHGIESID